jgi:hypothetical protein
MYTLWGLPMTQKKKGAVERFESHQKRENNDSHSGEAHNTSMQIDDRGLDVLEEMMITDRSQR